MSSLLDPTFGFTLICKAVSHLLIHDLSPQCFHKLATSGNIDQTIGISLARKLLLLIVIAFV